MVPTFRGCKVGGMLANLWPERHLASIFISVGYWPPDPDLSPELRIQMAKEQLGFDLFSYWKFFASEDSPRLLSEHVRIATHHESVRCSNLCSITSSQSPSTVSYSRPRTCFGEQIFLQKGNSKNGFSKTRGLQWRHGHLKRHMEFTFQMQIY